MPPKISVLLSDDDEEFTIIPICKPKAPKKPKRVIGYDFDCFPGHKPPVSLVSYLVDSVTGKEKDAPIIIS